MSKEIEEIKRILLKYNPTIKETLDTGLVETKSTYELEEFLNEITNKKLINNLESMDIVLICEHLRELEKKKYKMLKESREAEG